MRVALNPRADGSMSPEYTNEKWKGYQIHKIYREKKKAILIEQNQIVKLVDYSHDMRTIGEF